nr:hypothetical protein BaRGS_031258 [Batillaria attramentaria]
MVERWTLNARVVILAVWLDPRLHSPTNYLIANQAVSDLIYLAVVPVWVVNRWLGTWPGGNTLCKAVVYVQSVTSSLSIHTICAIAVERMRSISRSRGAAMSSLQTGVCAVALWVLNFCMSTVVVLETDAQIVEVDGQSLKFCRLDFMLGGSGNVGEAGVSASLRLERRLVLMLILSALLFVIMWAPSTVFSALLMAHQHDLLTPTILTAALAIVTFNTSINPLLLFHFNVFFRGDVREVTPTAPPQEYLLPLFPVAMAEKDVG